MRRPMLCPAEILQPIWWQTDYRVNILLHSYLRWKKCTRYSVQLHYLILILKCSM